MAIATLSSGCFGTVVGRGIAMWRRAVPGSAAAAGVTAMLLLAGETLADVSTLFANNDSTLISNTPSANDNSKILTVWVDGSDRRNAILGFRLGSLAPDLTEIHILDVQLRLAGGAEGTALGVYSSASNQTATWSESTVTWNSFNQPAGAANGANLLATTSVEPLDEWATWSSPELTAHLQSFADAAHPGAEAQVTLIVRAVTNDDSKSLFQSGEGPAGPSLIITYNRRLDVSMTATVTERREIFWDIEKSVDRDRWDLFRGDSGTSRYTIKVGKFELLQAPTVSGGIRVTNPASNAGYPAANITSITASLCNQALPVTCPGGASQTLDPGAALDCTYGPIQVISGCIYAATATTTGVVAGGDRSRHPRVRTPGRERSPDRARRRHRRSRRYGPDQHQHPVQLRQGLHLRCRPRHAIQYSEDRGDRTVATAFRSRSTAARFRSART